MKATIQYTEGLVNDKRVIYMILSKLNINVLASYYTFFGDSRIVISIDAPEDINHILYILNKNTHYGVSLISLTPTIKELIQKLFRGN